MDDKKIEYGTPVMTPLGPGVVAQRSKGITPKRSPAPGEWVSGRWVSGRWVSGVDASGEPFCEWIVLRDLRVLPPFEGNYPSKIETYEAFRAYMHAGFDEKERAARRSTVSKYLDEKGVHSVLDLKPEQRADAIAFIKERGEPPFNQRFDYEEVEARVQAALTNKRQRMDAMLAADMGPPQKQPPLDAMDLQNAIENTAKVLNEGLGFDDGEPAVVRSLLENHLSALLAVQMVRAKVGVAA